MKNTKAKGNRNEYKSMQLLEKEDIKCTRSAASLGVWDIIGIGKNNIYLIQVKSNRKPPKKEMEEISSFPDTFCNRCGNKISLRQIHVWKDYKRKPDITNLGDYMTVEMKNLKVMDCWQNLYDDIYTLKIEKDNRFYLVEMSVDMLSSGKIDEILAYIDVFFPNLNPNFTVKEITLNTNCGE